MSSDSTMAAMIEDDEVDECGPAIRRQFEYFFSDANLPHDAYMLGLTGGKENLPVSISRIASFKTMKQYKPLGRIKTALARSTCLEMTDNKHVRRRVALALSPKVKPSFDTDDTHKVLADKPWLTKAMLKPTGYEHDHAEPALTPEEYNQERECYNPDLPFALRIETAMQRYKARRKFHQENAHIFNHFLAFGGIETGPRQFTGGITKHDLEENTAQERAAITAIYHVPERVLDKTKWAVDFAGIAQGFLSTARLCSMGLDTSEGVAKITNVLTNFYRYLLHHDACPEYRDDIHKAINVCSIANTEAVQAVRVADCMPDGFNSACSVLFEGNYAGVFSTDESWDGADNIGWNVQEAATVFLAAVAVHGTPSQYADTQSRIGAATSTGDPLSWRHGLRTRSIEGIALQIVSIEQIDASARDFYDSQQIQNTFLYPIGKVHCRMARRGQPFPSDQELSVPQDELQTLWIEQDILQSCFVGMQIDAEVRTLDNGRSWLDSVRGVNGSYYLNLPNEHMTKEDDTVLPKEYLKRLRSIRETGWKSVLDMAVDDVVQEVDAWA